MNQTIIVPARVIPALSIFCAKRDVRYYLTGMLLDIGPTGAYLVATCGHIIAVAKIDPIARDPAQFIIPQETLSILSKDKKPGMTIDCADLSGSYDGQTRRQIQIRTGTGAFIATEVDGQFPDWRRVARKGDDDGKHISYNPHYLARIDEGAQIIRGGTKGRSDPVVVRPGGTGCGYASLDHEGNIGAWVMPTRTKVEDLPACPIWTI